VILRHALPVKEAGGAVVTRPRGDRVGHGFLKREAAMGAKIREEILGFASLRCLGVFAFDDHYAIFRAASCARRQSSAALNAWACVIAFSVRLRQSRTSWPKKRKPTLPATLTWRSPASSTM